MNILGLDASGKSLFLSLRLNGKETGHLEESMSQVELLPSVLDHFLQKYNLEPGQIEAMSLIRGPGSYTGLRGSLLLAKTLAMLKGTQVMTRLWHEVVLYTSRHQNRPLLVSMAVRQNEYYFAIGQFQAEQIHYLVEPQLVSAESLVTEYKKHLCPVLGDWPVSQEIPNEQLVFDCLSKALAEWTEIDFCPVPPDSLVPFYVRPAVRNLSQASHVGEAQS